MEKFRIFIEPPQGSRLWVQEIGLAKNKSDALVFQAKNPGQITSGHAAIIIKGFEDGWEISPAAISSLLGISKKAEIRFISAGYLTEDGQEQFV